jgi:hypothetical protein
MMLLEREGVLGITLEVLIMLSNGEIYHMAFQLWEDVHREHKQLSVVALRDHLKELNKQDLSKEQIEAKAREWIREKAK